MFLLRTVRLNGAISGGTKADIMNDRPTYLAKWATNCHKACCQTTPFYSRSAWSRMCLVCHSVNSSSQTNHQNLSTIFVNDCFMGFLKACAHNTEVTANSVHTEHSLSLCFCFSIISTWWTEIFFPPSILVLYNSKGAYQRPEQQQQQQQCDSQDSRVA